MRRSRRILSAFVVRVDRRCSRIVEISVSLSRIDRRDASVGWGEDGTEFALGERRGDGRTIEAGIEETVEGVGDAAGVFLRGVEIVDPVDLLGDVGEVEVGRERTHEPHGVDEVDTVEEVGELVAGGVGLLLAEATGEHPDLLDQFEELGAFLADDRLPELAADAADVGSEGFVGRFEQCRGHVGRPRGSWWLRTGSPLIRTPQARRPTRRRDRSDLPVGVVERRFVEHTSRWSGLGHQPGADAAGDRHRRGAPPTRSGPAG